MGKQVTADFAAMEKLTTRLSGVASAISTIDGAAPLVAAGTSLPDSRTAQACVAGGPRVTETLRAVAHAIGVASDTVMASADAYRQAEEEFRAALEQIGAAR